ncbi:crotonase/enoyl-CoA hydratase family protein [Streptomyces sp. NPDC019890]|uniref:crotonase/enoyl-CoA hydratase family protein n=1 Tax=Streptomyces sp. NPDC019890 TaxID=3365064 RepID=UPI00385031E5
MSAQGSAVLFERREHIGIVTLNRPEAMNAVNAALATALGNVLDECSADPEIWAVVITGRGRGFCAGADLKALAAGVSIHAEGHPEWGFAGMVRKFIDKPVIAAVNGFALGGGTEIVLACDLAVIDEHAELGLPEVKRGLLAAGGGVLRLQRQVPLKIALEAALTGEHMSAQTALKWGLVNRVAPAGTSLEVALGLAETIVANAPVAVQQSKAVVHRAAAYGSDWEGPMWDELNEAAVRKVFSSEDSVEGPAAFAQKRPPRWTGH